MAFRKLLVAGLLVLTTAAAMTTGADLLGSPSPTAASPVAAPAAPPTDDAGLDPALADALRRARVAAAADGVQLVVTSGWRSPEHQARLLREAIREHGSIQEASRWVATPETSPHVSGDAVDIAAEGREWLARWGADFGLCQIYRNEPWHFELRPEAVDGGCPRPYADPTEDPRMQP